MPSYTYMYICIQIGIRIYIRFISNICTGNTQHIFKARYIFEPTWKQDGVCPVDNRPSTNLLPHFVKTIHVTFNMGHVTWDTWHVTGDMWHVIHGGGWKFSQNFIFYCLGSTVSWRLGGKGYTLYVVMPCTIFCVQCIFL